jgi:hypothetical protein
MSDAEWGEAVVVEAKQMGDLFNYVLELEQGLMTMRVQCGAYMDQVDSATPEVNR